MATQPEPKELSEIKIHRLSQAQYDALSADEIDTEAFYITEGAEALSPTLEITKTDNTVTMTVGNVDGTTTNTSFTLPVRGTDYWTDEDVSAMKAYIDSQIKAVYSETSNESGGTTVTIEGA